MRADEGDKVDLQPLLFADGDKSVLDSGELGRVKIQAVVTGHELGKKIHGLKFKPKRGYKRRFGHALAPDPSGDQLDQGRRTRGRRQAGGLGWLIRRVLDQAATAATRTPKRLGVKVFAGQAVTGGEIIVRQRGRASTPARAPASAGTTRSLRPVPAPCSPRPAAAAA